MLTDRRIIIALLVILAVVIVATFGRFSCSAAAQSVEVVPPTTLPSGAQTPPIIKIDGGWTPGNVLILILFGAPALAAAVASIFVAVNANKRATTSEARQDAADKRMDRQSNRVDQALAQSTPTPPRNPGE